MRRLETEIVKDLFEKQFRDILRNFEFPKNVKKSTCCFTKVIDDGNRTKWSPTRSAIICMINKIG